MQYCRQSVTHSIRSAFEIRSPAPRASSCSFYYTRPTVATQMYQTINYGLFGICGLRINLAVFMCRPSREKAARWIIKERGRARARRKHRFQIKSRDLPLKKGGIRLVNGRAEDCSSVGYIGYACPGLFCWTSFVFGPRRWSFFEGLNN